MPPRVRTGARSAGGGQWQTVWRGITTGIYLAAMMVVTSRPGTAWARPGADGVFEIPVHPDLPTILHLPSAITGARVMGSSIRLTFAGQTLHVRPRAGVSTGLEALLEVETATMLLTFRLRVVARYQDARDELVVVALQSERRAEQGPLEPRVGDGEPAADASPEIPVHPKITTYLIFPDEIVRARFTGLVTGMMRATNLDEKLLIRPSAELSTGTEVVVWVQTATVRQRFRLRVVRRAADAWRHVVVLAPAAASPAPPAPPETTAPAALTRAVRMMIDGLVASRNTAAPGQNIKLAPTTAADAAAAPRPIESVTEHGAAPATERAGAAARPRRVAISIHAVVALAGTTELTRPGYNATQARQSHRAIGVRVTGRRPGASWGIEANVSGEWPVASTLLTMRDIELEMRGPWLRADVGLKTWFGTGLVPTASVGLGLQVHHRDSDVTQTKPVDTPESQRGGDMPFGGVLTVGLGLEYRMKNLSLGLELHVRQGVPAGYRSVSALLSAGWSFDRGE